MIQEGEIKALRHELDEINKEAIDYFKYHFELVRVISNEEIWNERHRVESNYWQNISAQEQEQGEAIAARLIEVMGKVALAVRASPLLEESDQRDLIVSTKKMRAALYFRRYEHWDTQVIHDEGTVLGVTRPGQSEAEALTVDYARKAFEYTYAKVNRILGMMTPGGVAPSALSAQPHNQIITRYRPNTAFIMMWMDREHPELDDVRDAIKSSFEAFGIKAVRADDIEHEDTITKRILDEIVASEFLIADLTGARPSVYYEVGYAHALGRRVILYRKKGTDLHFDLAVHNCPEYENLSDLKSKLKKRLQQLTNKSPAS